MNQIVRQSVEVSPVQVGLQRIIDEPIAATEFRYNPAVQLFTRELSRARQFEALVEQIAPAFHIRAAGTPRSGFVAELEAWNMGELIFIRTDTPPLVCGRTLKQCRTDGLDCLVISASRKRDPAHEGNSPMDLRIYYLDQPLIGRLEGGEAVHLIISRDFLRGAALPMKILNGMTVDSPLGSIFSDYLLNVARHMRDFSRHDVEGLFSSMRALLLACLSPTLEMLSEMQPVLDVAILERARRLVQKNLHSPSFGVDDLCYELAVSRSRLYRLFEPLGGVMHYVRSRRLLDAHMALSDSGDSRPIVDIAAERGFIDPAEFSRAFKREFGYRPSDARRNRHTNPPNWPRHDDGVQTLNEMLSTLS
jgi:AraC-like DNA-binding protein